MSDDDGVGEGKEIGGRVTHFETANESSNLPHTTANHLTHDPKPSRQIEGKTLFSMNRIHIFLNGQVTSNTIAHHVQKLKGLVEHHF